MITGTKKQIEASIDKLLFTEVAEFLMGNTCAQLRNYTPPTLCAQVYDMLKPDVEMFEYKINEMLFGTIHLEYFLHRVYEHSRVYP